MLKEIYLKAESGAKQSNQVKHRNRTVQNSSSNCDRPIRACLLFTGWNQSKNVDKNIDKTSSPSSISPKATKYLQPSFTSTAEVNSSNNHNTDSAVEIEDENKLVGHVIAADDRCVNNLNIQAAEQKTDLNNNNSKVVSFKKRSSSSRNFLKTKNSVKKQLSRLLSDKEEYTTIGTDLTARPTANLEQHTTGHRTSILASLRAASILLPLYGLHYLVFVYRLDTRYVVI